MTAGALSRGVIGVVISGLCRDLSEHSLLHFPVFSRGHSTLGQSPFTRTSEVNIPLHIAPIYPDLAERVTVLPEDWIVADEDGVVCVPRVLELDAIQLAEAGKRVDDFCLKDIRSGRPIQDTFQTYRGK